MSRIGRKPIEIPAGVEVKVEAGNLVTVKGKLGTLTQKLHKDMIIKMEGNTVVVERPSEEKEHKSLHGLTRTLLSNMITGVTSGYEKVLEINGVGYRAQKQGKKLTLSLGYSHPVEMEDPEGIETVLDGQNKITVKGIDKEKPHTLIPDRREAIRYAIASARRGDVVILAGKGHERYEISADGRHPFDERMIAEEALREYFPPSADDKR